MDSKSKIPVFGSTKPKSNVSIRLSINDTAPIVTSNNITSKSIMEKHRVGSKHRLSVIEKKNAISRIQHPMQPISQPKMFYKPTVNNYKIESNQIKKHVIVANDQEPSEIKENSDTAQTVTNNQDSPHLSNISAQEAFQHKENDDKIYEKVYLNNVSKNTIHLNKRMNKSSLSLNHLQTPLAEDISQKNSNNIENYDTLKESINSFKKKFTIFSHSHTNSLENSIDTIIENSDSLSSCEHIYDNFISSDYDMSKLLFDSEQFAKSSLMKYSCGNIDKNLKFNLESDEESIQEDQFNLNNNETNSSNHIDNLKSNTQIPDLNESDSHQDSSQPNHTDANRALTKTLKRKLKKSHSLSSPQKQTNTLFKNFAKRTSLCLTTAINLLNPPISQNLKIKNSSLPKIDSDMNFKAIKNSRKGSFTKSNSSGEINVKSNENKNLHSSQIDMNNSGTLSKTREFRPFESRINKGQETIIEECKNSLNELIKASKWPDKVKNTSSNYADIDSLHLEQIPSLNLSQNSLATSSVSSNYPIDLPNKSSGLLNFSSSQASIDYIKEFEQCQKKLFDSKQMNPIVLINDSKFTSPVTTETLIADVETNCINNKRLNNNYDNLTMVRDRSKEDEVKVVSPASSLVGGASQFNSRLFQLKRSQNAVNVKIAGLEVNNETLKTEEADKSIETTASQHKKSNSTKIPSVSYLKNSTHQNISPHSIIKKAAGSSDQLNNDDTNLLTTAAASSLTSSSDELRSSFSNTSEKSYQSPALNNDHRLPEKSTKSSTNKLIIKKKKSNKFIKNQTTAHEEPALSDRESSKRYSTHSEILANKKLVDQETAIKTLPPRSSFKSQISDKEKNQRRSTPAAILNGCESFTSFKSIGSVNSNHSVPVQANMSAKYNSCGISPAGSDSKPMTRSKSRKSLSKAETSSKQQFVEVDLEPSENLSHRKQNNSWIAQSFRKAFFGAKVESKKKLSTHKSQMQINQISNGSKMTSSISISNCAYAANQSLNVNDETSNYQRNSCNSETSKHSSLSDDEKSQTLNRRVSANSGPKLSLLPSNEGNNSDSEYEDNPSKFSEKSKNSTLVHKRSYRSESELAKHNLQIANQHTPSSTNETESAIKKSNKSCIPTSYSKLSKTHKSVNSLLTTSNHQNEQYHINQINKLHEINQPYTTHIKVNNERPKKCNCKINETIINDLKKKLTLAENKLTDIRLEALSSVHQVDQLKDYLDKTKNEMISLKSENQTLKKYIKENQTVNITKRFENSMNKKSLSENFIDECLSSNSNGMNKINQIFQTLNKSLNTYYYSYNFLLGDENESLLRKVLITVECSYQLKLGKSLNKQTPDSEFFAYEICTVNIDSKLNWGLMDGIISYVFKRYLNKLDPSQSMGLNKDSIDRYYIGEIVRKINDTKFPDMLPFGYLIGNACTIRIILKDDNENLDSLSYETLIPKYLLKDYVSLLEKHRLIGISSMLKFGKTYLMRKLGQFMSKNNNEELEMVYYNMEDMLNINQSPIQLKLDINENTNSNGFMEIKQKLLINIEMKLRGLPANKSVMILLDNFHILFMNNNDYYCKVPLEIVHSILKLIQRNKLYLIVTTQEQSYIENSMNSLEFNQNFKWISLNCNQVAFLSSYLNRNLIHYQVEQYKRKESCVVMEKVVMFLTDLFKLINEFMLKLGYTENASNLMSFMSLPFGIEISENWFIEMWNYSVIPLLNDIVKMKLIMNEKHRFNLNQMDLTEWIVHNYIWPKNENNIHIQQRLLRVKYMSDIITNRISSSSDDSELHLNNISDNKNQNLISMLLRLQKAAYQEETSSGFFDSSNSSNSSPKSNSPMSMSAMSNLNFKETSDLFNSITVKSKIESAL